MLAVGLWSGFAYLLDLDKLLESPDLSDAVLLQDYLHSLLYGVWFDRSRFNTADYWGKIIIRSLTESSEQFHSQPASTDEDSEIVSQSSAELDQPEPNKMNKQPSHSPTVSTESDDSIVERFSAELDESEPNETNQQPSHSLPDSADSGDETLKYSSREGFKAEPNVRAQQPSHSLLVSTDSDKSIPDQSSTESNQPDPLLKKESFFCKLFRCC